MLAARSAALERLESSNPDVQEAILMSRLVAYGSDQVKLLNIGEAYAPYDGKMAYNSSTNSNIDRQTFILRKTAR